jgi:adenylate kinase
MARCAARPACVCVGGVSGVGKTTLLRAYAAATDGIDEHVSASRIVQESIAPASFDEMDRLPESERVALRTLCAPLLRQRRDRVQGRLLVDNHFTHRNRTTGEIERILTEAELPLYDAFVVIQAPARELLRFRHGDDRARPTLTCQQIEELLSCEHTEALRLAQVANVPLLVIDAVALDDRLAALRDFLDRHFPLVMS